MLRNNPKRITTLLGVMLLAAMQLIASSTVAQSDSYRSYDYATRSDRYLAAEVWTDHADAEYYEGSNIRIQFRVSRDAFVAIYSIDTRGRVELIFPSSPTQDNFVYGGVTNAIPSPDAEYDLVVSGPEGLEHIQIIASRDRFPIPNWYNNSGLIFEGDDRYDYMDFLNNKYFVKFDGQRFAYDRAAIFVNEWEDYYYEPVYYPSYPSWTVAGNMYVDYPYGSTVYIDGIYWGIAPLYVPRLAVGWYTLSIYDYYGYGWESDFHISNYNTTVFDQRVIKTSSTTVSKYASVRKSGYLDPVSNGYPRFSKKGISSSKSTVGKSTRTSSGASYRANKGTVGTKKYLRGTGEVVKTSRGYETGVTSVTKRSGTTRSSSEGSYRSSGNSRSGKSITSSRSKSSSGRSSGGYYQKKSGSSKRADGYRSTSRSSKGSSKSGNARVKSGSSKRSSKGAIRSGKSSTKSRSTIKSSGGGSKSKGRSGSSRGVSKRSSGKSSGGSMQRSSGSSRSGSSKSGSRSSSKGGPRGSKSKR